MSDHPAHPAPTIELLREDLPSGAFATARDQVAVEADDPLQRQAIDAALSAALFTVAGHDSIGTAEIVVAHLDRDVAARIRGLRARMGRDAALIAVVASADVGAALDAGAYGCVHVPITPGELVALARAATEVRSARVQVADLERRLELERHLASLGRISAGLTHEIGNPLSVATLGIDAVDDGVALLGDAHRHLREILSAVEPAEILRRVEDARTAPIVRAHLDLQPSIADVRRSLERIADLLRMMRELVARRPVEIESVDLVAVTEEAIRWATPRLGPIVIERVFEGRPSARGNRHLVEQILVNVVSNAISALRDAVEPRLRLHVYLRDGDAVVSIRDNGRGIPESVHEQIFEPFFTTRRREGGMGLGLALCREYARKIDGRLSFWSAPGRGTCFRVHLRAEEPRREE